jgi:hypothetical protein
MWKFFFANQLDIEPLAEKLGRPPLSLSLFLSMIYTNATHEFQAQTADG